MSVKSLDYEYSVRENSIRNLKHTQEMLVLNQQNINIAVAFNKIAATASIKDKFESELSSLINTLGMGSDNRTPEALKNVKVGLARARRAFDVLEFSQQFETYEFVIKSMNDKQLDAQGLPKYPVRVFIASQKAVLRNNISSELCSDSEREFFKARIKNLNALEKEYKPIQKRYMDTFIQKNPAHPTSEIYLKKNPNLQNNQQKYSEFER